MTQQEKFHKAVHNDYIINNLYNELKKYALNSRILNFLGDENEYEHEYNNTSKIEFLIDERINQLRNIYIKTNKNCE